MVANPQPESEQRPAVTLPPEPKSGFFTLSPLNRRRWSNFKRNHHHSR